MDNVVELTGICKSYRGRAALRDISFSVARNEFLAICGQSGSGKTTLLHIIGGICQPDAGVIRVGSKDLIGLSDDEIANFRNESIAFVFQSFNLIEHLTALENVLLPRFFSRRKDPQVEERAKAALSRVGLQDRAHDRSQTLSGGQRQRVALARALFTRPPLLLADEPTGNLDSQTGKDITGLLSELVRDEGMTLIVVTHEERVSTGAGRILHLEDGRLV